MFQWEPVEPSCEAIHYLINASNCGHCPNVTNDTTVTCTGFTLDMYDQVCLLSVRTVVCHNITGNESGNIQVTLRGISHFCYNYYKCDAFLKAPSSPKINVIPTYSYNSKTLLRLTTRFNETVRPEVCNLYRLLTTIPQFRKCLILLME